MIKKAKNTSKHTFNLILILSNRAQREICRMRQEQLMRLPQNLWFVPQIRGQMMIKLLVSVTLIPVRQLKFSIQKVTARIVQPTSEVTLTRHCA